MTQATYPEFSGKAVASSAVIIASGTLQINGSIKNPKIARSGPPSLTASYTNTPGLAKEHSQMSCKFAALSGRHHILTQIQLANFAHSYLNSERATRHVIEDEGYKWKQSERFKASDSLHGIVLYLTQHRDIEITSTCTTEAQQVQRGPVTSARAIRLGKSMLSSNAPCRASVETLKEACIHRHSLHQAGQMLKQDFSWLHC